MRRRCWFLVLACAVLAVTLTTGCAPQGVQPNSPKPDGSPLACLLFGPVLVAGCNPQRGFNPPTSQSAGSVLTSPASEASAELELATRLIAGRGVNMDRAAGVSLMERLANGGNATAQYLMGEYYFTGTGVEKNIETGASWMQRAASQDHPFAQAELAFLYVAGFGVTKDYGKAYQLAKSASDHGNAEGDDILGTIYANGWGVAADDRQANRWYAKAADKKYSIAMRHLGDAYRDGKGVVADKIIAAAWFDLAYTNAVSPADRQNAAKSRDDLALVLLPPDLALATRLAADWKPGEDLVAKRDRVVGAQPAGAVETPVASVNVPINSVATASSQQVESPVVMKSMIYEIEVALDGSRTTKVHYELEAKNEAAVKDVAQVPLGFTESLQKVDVLEAFTQKRDGRKLSVDPSAIYTQLAPNTPTIPMFDDQRQKVVVFPNVEAGDVTVVTARYTAKPNIPGYFGYSTAFDLTAAHEDTRITITTPKTMPLVTETHGLKFERRDAGDKTVYEWRYTNLKPLAEANIALDPLDRWPRLFASNFQSYEQLAKAYAQLAEPKSTVTPQIRKLAEEVTAGVSDRKKQAELIYNWVGRHIRYVAVEIGVGAYVPHDADRVLTNAYGDCKDHTVLFSALLKAKGIASEIVLINLGVSYTLAAPPTLGAMNHAITWLPEFKMYADTTATVAPFGTLPFTEYGKPVLHATASGDVMRRTPELPADATSVDVKTSARLTSDGRIIGDSESTARGSFSLAMRLDAIDIQSAGLEQAARYQLRSKGYEGSGKFEFVSPFDVGPTFRVAGHFETSPRSEVLRGNSFYLPTGLIVGTLPGDFLMGSLSFRDFRGDEPTPCYSGHEQEELSLELPQGKHLQTLPKGTEIKNKYLHFKSEWSLTERTVTVRRDFSSTVDQAVCIGEVRLTTAKALDDIRKDYSVAIALVDD